MQLTTLPELGHRLPFRSVSFTTKQWKGKQEKEINTLVGNPEGKSFAQFATILLSVLVTSVGQTDYEKMTTEDRVQFWGKMYSGDVLYAYVFVRYESMGKIFTFRSPCPVCQKEMRISADLSTMQVRVADSESEIHHEYLLRGDPVKVGKTEFDRLLVTAPRFSVASPIVGGILEAKMLLIQNCVRIQNEDCRFPILTNVMEQLDKSDIEGLSAVIESLNFGPETIVDHQCESCQADHSLMIDWRYPGFFSVSPATRDTMPSVVSFSS